MRKWSLGRFSIQLALGLAMLVAAAVLAIAFMALQTERRLRTSLASIRAAGDPSSISELAPKPIPKDKNAAVVLAGLGPQLDAFSKDHARFFYTPSGKAYEARTDEGEQATEEQIAAIRAILEKYPEIPTGLTQAAEREQYASLADYSLDHQKFLDQWLKKYVGRIRAAGRFLQWRNEVLLAEGKHEEAVEQGVELLRLARLYDGEPLMVNYLVGVAVRGIAVNMLYDALAAGPVRPELHAALEKELALHDTPQRIVHALKTDRAYSASLAPDGGANPNTKENPILVSLFGWTLKRHFISALDYSDEQIAMVQKSWPNANRRLGEAALRARVSWGRSRR